jgi:para-aminobenzoate synthetase component 1
MNTYGGKKIPFLFVISYSQQDGWVIPLSQIQPDEICYSIPGNSNIANKEATSRPFFFHKNPESFNTYLEKFNYAQKQIAYGNTYLINLTCSTPVHTDLSLEDIFLLSQAKYKLWVKDLLAVFSPEPFIRISRSRISSFPMKGTINADIPDAAKVLMADEKELAEHYTITDLIRNDLSIVAKNVKVEAFRYLETLQTNFGPLLQASSVISGELQSNYAEHIGNIVFSMLPAGSVTGAPKQETVRIISDCEDYERGFYTGVFGIFDGENLESSVMIRFIESTGKGLIFKSGGGITSFSSAEKEYQEMIDKVYVPIT